MVSPLTLRQRPNILSNDPGSAEAGLATIPDIDRVQFFYHTGRACAL
jgi:hypothetical protein